MRVGAEATSEMGRELEANVGCLLLPTAPRPDHRVIPAFNVRRRSSGDEQGLYAYPSILQMASNDKLELYLLRSPYVIARATTCRKVPLAYVWKLDGLVYRS